MKKSYKTFIKKEALLEVLNDSDVIIIDCRFDLLNPAWGFKDYLKSHLPGSIYADLDNDLSGKKSEQTGRHPLPDPEVFIKTCSKWGIDQSKQVVVYDTTFGSYAARLWWMLRYFGHQKVALLNGGFTNWIQAGLPVVSGNYSNEPALFVGVPDNSLLVTTNEMESIIKRDEFIILDARSNERYRGIEEPIDKIAGRIPNSINFFHQNNLDTHGILWPDETLHQRYSQLLGNQINNEKIVYCGSGVTSCLNVAVMNHINLSNTRLYLGSWSEWIQNPDHPIVKESSIL